MKVIAIDPGTYESAHLVWDGKQIVMMGITANEELLDILGVHFNEQSLLAVEMIASYGMAVGKEVFDTCLWIGRFIQQWHPAPARLVYRREIKQHHCMSNRATDANVRQALIDRFGAPGTKANQGLLYGVKKHLWSAMAIASYTYDTMQQMPPTGSPVPLPSTKRTPGGAV